MNGWKLLSLVCFIIFIFTMAWNIFWIFLIASGFFFLIGDIIDDITGDDE